LTRRGAVAVAVGAALVLGGVEDGLDGSLKDVVVERARRRWGRVAAAARLALRLRGLGHEAEQKLRGRIRRGYLERMQWVAACHRDIDVTVARIDQVHFLYERVERLGVGTVAGRGIRPHRQAAVALRRCVTASGAAGRDQNR